MAKASAAKKGPKNPPKRKTKPTVPGASGAVPSDHNSRLTPDDERRLFASHRQAWIAHTAKQKALDEQRTKIVAALKADGFKVLHMDIADDLGNPKGEKKQTDAVADRLKVARWIGHPMGAQLDLFAQPDRTPSVDRAYDEGKQASMDGAAIKPPYDPSTPQYQSWMAGFNDDQKRLQEKVGKGPQAGRKQFQKDLQETIAEGDKQTHPQSAEGTEPAATAPGSETTQ